MRQRRWMILALLIVAAGLPAAIPLPASAQGSIVEEAGAGPFLPWPPLLPDPRPVLPFPPGVPPFAPPVGPAGGTWPVDPADATWWTAPAGSVPILQDLSRFIGVLEQARDLLAQWAGTVQQAVSNALARMIWESPGLLPQGVQVPDITGQIAMFPDEVRAAIDALLAKLRSPVAPGSSDARHQAYTASSPALSREAVGIAASDQVITSMAVQQAAASRATALAAAGAARDTRLPTAVGAGYQAGQMLVESAGQVPSTRAGVELLVAAQGMAMRQQADLTEAVADRLSVLAQQTAAVSQQIGTLAVTAGTLAARETERDRRALDARLGLADILGEAGRLLQQMLAGAGEPSASETGIDPLY